MREPIQGWGVMITGPAQLPRKSVGIQLGEGHDVNTQSQLGTEVATGGNGRGCRSPPGARERKCAGTLDKCSFYHNASGDERLVLHDRSTLNTYKLQRRRLIHPKQAN